MRLQRHGYQRAINNWTHSKVYSEATLRIGRNDQHHSMLTRHSLPHGGKEKPSALSERLFYNIQFAVCKYSAVLLLSTP